jgi:hypothetical protein
VTHLAHLIENGRCDNQTVSLFASLIFYADIPCLIFQLLDLFSLDDKKKDNQKSSKSQPVPSHALTMKSVLDTLPDLWEEQQYEEEYDLTNFMNSLRN